MNNNVKYCHKGYLAKHFRISPLVMLHNKKIDCTSERARKASNNIKDALNDPFLQHTKQLERNQSRHHASIYWECT